MTKTRKQKSSPQYWTKDEIKKLLTIWEQSSLEEICDALSREKSQVLSMARQIKKNGYELASKKKNGIRAKMIKEVLSELGLVKSVKKS